jgi:hypothetical protein
VPETIHVLPGERKEPQGEWKAGGQWQDRMGASRLPASGAGPCHPTPANFAGNLARQDLLCRRRKRPGSRPEAFTARIASPARVSQSYRPLICVRRKRRAVAATMLDRRPSSRAEEQPLPRGWVGSACSFPLGTRRSADNSWRRQGSSSSQRGGPGDAGTGALRRRLHVGADEWSAAGSARTGSRPDCSGADGG